MSAAPRPYVTAHTAVSLDGASTGFEPDQARFYELAATFGEDVTLAGADTILAQEPALAGAPRPGPARDGPLLAVVDGRGRVREWRALREVGHWSDVLALHAAGTPPRAPDRAVDELVTGRERVDLAAALAELGRRGARRVRVDSGGALTGALLRAGLVDEISLLVHPVWSGDRGARRWYGEAGGPPGGLTLVANRSVGDSLVWLYYRTGS
ncbi:RibD family protein [Pseudonocardia humida]|uniref:Dihydrofolate reductase family protein n=1 Tax=Pseudonocardia humida TaxID=2800819 RepID=A0ABT0ZXD7_9PSEU|nr:dihydrofolate reductase family protein [Pseudonocardia humida]MCO1655404.1 dihydrofolate reductase family protein [Pseudonocardia humida]